MDFFRTGIPDASEYAPDEAEMRERTANFFANESGYSAIQSTKSQTISYGLNDSPVGLCAWLVEKRRDWSDCGGGVERRLTKDELSQAPMPVRARSGQGLSPMRRRAALRSAPQTLW
jgi:hypothetical protein